MMNENIYIDKCSLTINSKFFFFFVTSYQSMDSYHLKYLSLKHSEHCKLNYTEEVELHCHCQCNVLK